VVWIDHDLNKETMMELATIDQVDYKVYRGIHYDAYLEDDLILAIHPHVEQGTRLRIMRVYDEVIDVDDQGDLISNCSSEEGVLLTVPETQPNGQTITTLRIRRRSTALFSSVSLRGVWRVEKTDGRHGRGIYEATHRCLGPLITWHTSDFSRDVPTKRLGQVFCVPDYVPDELILALYKALVEEAEVRVTKFSAEGDKLTTLTGYIITGSNRVRSETATVRLAPFRSQQDTRNVGRTCALFVYHPGATRHYLALDKENEGETVLIEYVDEERGVLYSEGTEDHDPTTESEREPGNDGIDMENLGDIFVEEVTEGTEKVPQIFEEETPSEIDLDNINDVIEIMITAVKEAQNNLMDAVSQMFALTIPGTDPPTGPADQFELTETLRWPALDADGDYVFIQIWEPSGGRGFSMVSETCPKEILTSCRYDPQKVQEFTINMSTCTEWCISVREERQEAAKKILVDGIAALEAMSGRQVAAARPKRIQRVMEV
jgi:hypothetical protein